MKIKLFALLPLLCALLAAACVPGTAAGGSQKGGRVPAQPTRESWAWRYGGLRGDFLKALLPTKDGGFILAGDTRSFRTGKNRNYSKDPSDLWVVKLDAEGQLVWQRTYSGDRSDVCAGIVAAEGGGYVLAATTESFGAGMTDVWLLRLDEGGGVLWERTYGGERGEQAGAVARDADGSFIIAGDTESFIPALEHPKWTQPGKESRVVWAFKVDGRGEPLWQRSYVTESEYCQAQAVVPAGGGRFVLGSSCRSFVWLLKVSGATGQPAPDEGEESLSWSRGFYGRVPARHWVKDSKTEKQVELRDASGVPFQTLLSTLVPAGEGFAMTGADTLIYSEGGNMLDCLQCAGWSGYWVARVDGGGKVVWARSLGEGVPGYSSPFSVHASPEGYVVAGDLNNMPQPPLRAAPWSVRRSHAALLRFDQRGELVWQKEIGGNKDFVKPTDGDPETFAYQLTAGEYVLARTFHPDKGRKDEDFQLLKLYEEDARNTCATEAGQFFTPRVLDLGGRRVVVGTSLTKARMSASTCRVEASAARPEPACN